MLMMLSTHIIILGRENMLPFDLAKAKPEPATQHRLLLISPLLLSLLLLLSIIHTIVHYIICRTWGCINKEIQLNGYNVIMRYQLMHITEINCFTRGKLWCCNWILRTRALLMSSVLLYSHTRLMKDMKILQLIQSCTCRIVSMQLLCTGLASDKVYRYFIIAS